MKTSFHCSAGSYSNKMQIIYLSKKFPRLKIDQNSVRLLSRQYCIKIFDELHILRQDKTTDKSHYKLTRLNLQQFITCIGISYLGGWEFEMFRNFLVKLSNIRESGNEPCGTPMGQLTMEHKLWSSQ